MKNPTNLPLGASRSADAAPTMAAQPETVQQSVSKLRAEVLLGLATNALVTQSYLKSEVAPDVTVLIAELRERAAAVAEGDLRGPEAMLVGQVSALQAMFVDLAMRAKREDHLDDIEKLTNLALKAASGVRQAISALGDLKAPKTAIFARQANVSSGPQQVNNEAVGTLASTAQPALDVPNDVLASPGHTARSRAEVSKLSPTKRTDGAR